MTTIALIFDASDESQILTNGTDRVFVRREPITLDNCEEWLGRDGLGDPGNEYGYAALYVPDGSPFYTERSNYQFGLTSVDPAECPRVLTLCGFADER